LLKGYYEQAEIAFVGKYIQPGAYVVELGASIGIISCHILKKSPLRLLSFEALGAWAQLARKTVGLNFENPPFELKEMAIGKVGQKEVQLAFDSHENLGGQVVEGPGKDKRPVVKVPAMSLAEVNEIYHVPPNAWIVMDIEGAEWDLVRNQAYALRRYEGDIVECRQVENESGRVKPRDILDEFQRCGFTLVECVEHYTHLVACLRRASG